jgi:hypothetical protein
MKRVKIFFKQAARHKKPWRCEKFLKKNNNIRPASHKYIRKTWIIQKNFSMNAAFVPTEQVSDRMTRNSRNRNNQIAASMPTEDVFREISLWGVNPISSGIIASRNMGTTSR